MFCYFSPGWVEQADVNVDLSVVAVICRCVSRCVQSSVCVLLLLFSPAPSAGDIFSRIMPVRRH